MSQEKKFPTGPMLLTFLAGAAVGAVMVALTTPRTGPQLRENLKDLARRPKRNGRDIAEEAQGAWNDIKDRTALAAAEIKRDVSDAVNNLKG